MMKESELEEYIDAQYEAGLLRECPDCGNSSLMHFPVHAVVPDHGFVRSVHDALLVGGWMCRDVDCRMHMDFDLERTPADEP